MLPFHLVTVLGSDYPELARGEAPPGWLGADEAATLSGLRFPARRHKWLLGRIAAKRAVTDFFAATGRSPPSPPEIVIANLPSGQPYARVAGERLPRPLSLSHREPVGVAAIGPGGGALGVDVELVEPRDPALVRDFFTTAEAAAVAAASGRESVLLLARTWSAKEAVLKALGLGLRRDTRTIEVGGELAAADDTPPGWRPLAVTLTDPEPTLALCFQDHQSYVLTIATIVTPV